jgi:hypothetical protein
MKRTRKKLALNRDTVRSLTTPTLGEVVGGGTGTNWTCTCVVSCAGTCGGSCFTCTCPTRCQWNCTAIC